MASIISKSLIHAFNVVNVSSFKHLKHRSVVLECFFKSDSGVTYSVLIGRSSWNFCVSMPSFLNGLTHSLLRDVF